MSDKYGLGQDAYCYPGTDTLKNLLDIKDATVLQEAERDLSDLAAGCIEFCEPPYDLKYLKNVHRLLFSDIYGWAGAIRIVDISKNNSRFCTVDRIIPESEKIFDQLSAQGFLVGLGKDVLIKQVAELYTQLNAIHPFREGNGRAQRIIFEHIIVNCGFEISWVPISNDDWLEANIQGFFGNNDRMRMIFSKCIGEKLT